MASVCELRPSCGYDARSAQAITAPARAHGGCFGMDTLSAESFIAALAIIGVVIIVSALLSGLIERSGLPQVAVFLALGAVLGPAGLGLLNLALDSPTLRVVATLSL